MNRSSLFFLLIAILAGRLAIAQSAADQYLPEFQVTQPEVEASLRFLAADELLGRRTGSEGNNIAARYIAAQLQAYGLQPVEGSYFQKVPLVTTRPPADSRLMLDKTEYAFGDDYIIMAGEAAELNTTAVFAGHGWVDAGQDIDDYQGLDVAGKIVFVLSGYPGGETPNQVFESMAVKQRLARERGAAALIEIYNLNFPWNFFRRYFGGESMRLDSEEEEKADGGDLVYGWIKNIGQEEVFARIKADKKVKATLSSSGFSKQDLGSNNVIGLIEGSDPALRDEYVLLSAHYDHVGAGREGGGAYTEQDSIFNGARDNAMGTVALLTAARSLALERPRRSVIILAVTGEELGLLGSNYYAGNPLLPLDQTVFNLNTDGAGYNDPGAVSIIGFGRTGTDAAIEAAAAAAGLQVIADPAPEQNLFDRSDNVAFAKKGVPALTFSPGFDAFDEEISKYYHQVTDEADAVDMGYLLQYCQAYAHLARLIANAGERPQWKEGDKYEEAGKTLYGNK